MARLQILLKDDFERLYRPPYLIDDERQFAFEIDEKDQIYINSLNGIPAKIHFILNLGYFRISQYFFTCTFQQAKSDVKFIINTYFPGAPFPTKNISSRQYYTNRKMILEYYGMQLYSKDFEAKLKNHLKELTQQHALPRYLFESSLHYCHQNKIVRPSYSVLQDIISAAYNQEKTRITNKLYNLMDDSLRQSLNTLLSKGDLFYYLTVIKKDQKDFSTTEIRASIEKHDKLSTIYSHAVKIIKALSISPQNIEYYSELAELYTAPRLKDLKPQNLARIYLLCYIYNRFLKINDHLIFSFLYRTNKYIDEADVYQKEEIYNEKVADQDNRIKAAQILSLHIDKKVLDQNVRSKSFEIVPKQEFKQFVQKIKKPHLDPDYYRWTYYKKHAHAIKCNIRPIFKILNFDCKSKDLDQAIVFLKSHFIKNKSFRSGKVPIDFVNISARKHLYTTVNKIKLINADVYEFMLYMQVVEGIDKGKVTIRDSLSYKAFEDELLPLSEWQIEKNKILKSIESQLVTNDLNDMLTKLEPLLTRRYQEVNDRINSGANNKIKIKYNKQGEMIHWHTSYKKMEDSINNPYYDKMSIIDLSQVTKFANHYSQFMKGFTHILPSCYKTKPSEEAISASIIAKAIGNDISCMKYMSDINEKLLLNTYNNYIRQKTIVLASNKLIDKMAMLPIFKEYNLSAYGIHASVDGQKLETRYNTIKSRHSKKYYGLGQGVSANTLLANYLPLCTRIIGANEHESYYLLDMVRSNSSTVTVAAVSGDMHSVNRVNYILLYIFGYKFMPRFTRIDKKAKNNLVSFDDPKNYKDYIVKPAARVNKSLVLKESDNVLRIFATLALKQNTQSNIVRKLSSHKLNDTMKALIELDKVIMSLYILDYIDDENIRQSVHRALNRGESYHQLRAAISKVSGNKLLGRKEKELNINNECTRLIALCIIFYNAYLLSKIYEYCKNNGLEVESRKIIRLSPIAWQHINLVGKYEFTKNVELSDIDNVMQLMIKNLDQVVLVVSSKKKIGKK
jgi:TnpA family transposase